MGINKLKLLDGQPDNKRIDIFGEIGDYYYWRKKVVKERKGMGEEIDAFGILEDKITELVDAYTFLKKERISLEEKLKQKESELQSLKENITILVKERELAKQKIENLLTRLDRILAHGQAD